MNDGLQRDTLPSGDGQVSAVRTGSDVRAAIERGMNFNRACSYVKSYPQISGVSDFASATVEEIWAGYERCRANRHLAPQVEQGEKDLAAEWGRVLDVLATEVVPTSERDRYQAEVERLRQWLALIIDVREDFAGEYATRALDGEPISPRASGDGRLS